MQASSRDEIKELLRKDVYASSGVWDVENVSLLTDLKPTYLPSSMRSVSTVLHCVVWCCREMMMFVGTY
jgi:hypothetical protein